MRPTRTGLSKFNRMNSRSRLQLDLSAHVLETWVHFFPEAGVFTLLLSEI